MLNLSEIENLGSNGLILRFSNFIFETRLAEFLSWVKAQGVCPHGKGGTRHDKRLAKNTLNKCLSDAEKYPLSIITPN